MKRTKHVLKIYGVNNRENKIKECSSLVNQSSEAKRKYFHRKKKSGPGRKQLLHGCIEHIGQLQCEGGLDPQQHLAKLECVPLQHDESHSYRRSYCQRLPVNTIFIYEKNERIQTGNKRRRNHQYLDIKQVHTQKRISK